jgi:amino acid transporter
MSSDSKGETNVNSLPGVTPPADLDYAGPHVDAPAATTFIPAIDVAQLPDAAQRRRVNVLVVSSVALAFISFWRASAIVLCDLASTAYYIGGISEQAIGKAAPWFILGVMLFSYAVRAVYVESCTMFTRGGVYKVVKEAMGGGLAKLSVSALMFDYVLTGPISAVAAGQYIVGLFIDMLNLIHHHKGSPPIDPTAYKSYTDLITVVISILITIYFWRLNIIGIHESSDKALRIMQLTTVMGVVIIGWSLLTMALHPDRLHMPPFHPVFTSDTKGGNEGSSGWLGAFPRVLGTFGVLVAFGHTLLAMSGEESLAQVNREIEAPKLKNLLRAGFVIFVYSMLLTSLISFFAVFIIPDGKRVSTMIVPDGHETSDPNVVKVDYLRQDSDGRLFGYKIDDSGELPKVDNSTKIFVNSGYHVARDDGGYRDNLINGLVQYLSGPHWLKIGLECFVVIVGFLILAGAVNTSIVGSNGVMNRLAEDGVLTPWFLHPQAKYGTTHRLINLVVVLQLITIVASWGDVDTLGEAYAFGVIWSFVFKTLAMVVLRFKDKSPRAYEVPFNIRIKRPAVAGAAAGHVNVHAERLKAVEALGRFEEPAVAIDGMGHLAKVDQAAPADDVNPKPAMHHGSGNHIDLPIGIMIIFLILLSTALINLVTKKTATIWGLGFTIAFLAAFMILEQVSRRRRGGGHFEQVNQRSSSDVTIESVGLSHPSPIVIAARGPRSLPVLERILKDTNTDERDVVVVTCKVLPPKTAGVTAEEMRVNDEDRQLLTKIVTVAEEVGKQVFPVVLPTNNPLYAIATTARDLKAREVVLGVSEKVHAEDQLENFALAWGSANADQAGETPPLTVRILGPQIEMKYEL